MNWETILFFGDSLTVGARGYLGFPEYVGDILAKRLSKEWNIINNATNGFRAIDLARSISNNYAGLTAQNPLVSVILIGTNDAKSGTNNDEYRIAVEQIIIKAKLLTLNENVLLLSIPELAAGVAYPYNQEMNNAIYAYNDILVKLASKHKTGLLSIPTKDEHYFDGVHFNREGTIFFAQSIAHKILKDRGL